MVKMKRNGVIVEDIGVEIHGKKPFIPRHHKSQAKVIWLGRISKVPLSQTMIRFNSLIL